MGRRSVRMRALSLFTGIGGLDLAAHAAGIETAEMCEIDPFATEVLKRRFPDVPIYADIRLLSRRRLKGDGITGISVIHGGFPCQDVSLSGKRAGFIDSDGNTTRSGLWGEFARLIREIKPRWVVAENVLGLLSNTTDRKHGGYSELFCETWPKWGIVLDGAATALRMLAASTKERESRLWPTPLASDGIAWTKNARLDCQISISRIIKRGGTLRAIYPLMYIGLSAPQCAELYEMMMGYPKGWTDLKLSEMRLSLNNFTWSLGQLWK